jgi:hypothetical protein
MANVRVVRTEEKSKAHLTHYLSDGRYITEDRHSNAKARWTLWTPTVSGGGKYVATASSLGKLLKWADRHPV